MPTSYGTPATATITLDGLGIGEEAISSAIDNSTTKFDKLYVMLKIYTGVVRTQGYLTIGLIYSLDNSTFADKHPSSQEIQIYPPSFIHFGIAYVQQFPYVVVDVKRRRNVATKKGIDAIILKKIEIIFIIIIFFLKIGRAHV